MANIEATKLNKTKELFVHVCRRLQDEKTFGSIVLNKVLYHIDNISYLSNGEPVSGFTYVKQVNGPTPKPNQFLSLRDLLLSENRIVIEERPYWNRKQKVHKAITDADLSEFSRNEILLIEDVIDVFKDANASMASEASHDFLAWKIAQPMEELPF